MNAGVTNAAGGAGGWRELALVVLARRGADGGADLSDRVQARPRRPRRQRRRAVLDLERRLGRAHAGRRSAARVRRQHLLSRTAARWRTRRATSAPARSPIPVYWATRNPYAAHNFVDAARVRAQRHRHVLPGPLPDRRSARGGRLGDLLRVLPVRLRAHRAHPAADDGRAAVHACWRSTAWPIGPAPARGAALGVAMAAQAICCGYYGVFVVLMVGFAVARRGRDAAACGRSRRTGSRSPSARSSRSLLVAPAFRAVRHAAARRASSATLTDAARSRPTGATTWRARRTRTPGCSRYLPRWHEVSFPGFVAPMFGVGGVWVAARRRASASRARCTAG